MLSISLAATSNVCEMALREVITFYQSHNLYQTARKFAQSGKCKVTGNNALQIADFLARHLHSIKLEIVFMSQLNYYVIGLHPRLENAPIIGAHCLTST